MRMLSHRSETGETGFWPGMDKEKQRGQFKLCLKAEWGRSNQAERRGESPPRKEENHENKAKVVSHRTHRALPVSYWWEGGTEIQ